MSFANLGLSDPLLRALEGLEYAQATPIQQQAIPLALEGRDVLAAAQTGSGKTAAFALPTLQRLASETGPRTDPRALVLVPTRELAAQVSAAFERYGREISPRLRSLAIFGGAGIHAQAKAASHGADIVVATPGRLLDLMERGALRLDAVSILVLDEADRLLALGFADELNAILARLPGERQNLFFSATFPPAVVAMANALLKDPADVRAEAEAGPVGSIRQRAIEVEQDSRTALLRHLLETENWERVLVFVATKRRAANVAAKLARQGILATALHGDLSQEQRSRALEDFKRSKVRVLMATDVAARGLDIVGLPCVVNYDLPRAPADFVHRIGRTGRAGATGLAVTFVTQEDDAHFRLIEKRAGQSVERERVEGFVPSEWNPLPSKTGQAPVKGKRKSKKDKLREAAARESSAASGNDPWEKARRNVQNLLR